MSLFWNFIEDCEFLNNNLQTDVCYYNLIHNKNYNKYTILSFEEEYKKYFLELKNKSSKRAEDYLFGFIISKGKSFYENYLINYSVDLEDKINFEFLTSIINPLNIKCHSFSLIFSDFENGSCYPKIKDEDNLFFSLSNCSTSCLYKLLLINSKEFIIKELISRGINKQVIDNIIKSQIIRNF